MNFLTKKRVALALVVSLSSLWLVGCGITPQPIKTASEATRAAAITQSPSQLAADFARPLAASGVAVTVQGALVILQDAEGKPVTYDFSQTPKTKKVVFKAGEVTTTLDYQNGEVTGQIAWRLVYIGVKMVYGGAKAWWWYTHTHTGANYDRTELVKAIVYGIIAEGVGGLPGGFLWKRLLPLVWKWVSGEAPIKPTLKDLFDLMKKDVGEVASILAEGERLQRAGAL